MPDAPAPHPQRASLIDSRNLRRTDWRVLLPIPPNGFEHMVLLGGPKALSDVIVEIGLAQRVSREIPTKPSADAVAILRGARAGWEDAAGALIPGGSLYWEVGARRAEAAWIRSRIERSLRLAGLSLTGLYWVLPDFERCEQFIPIVRTAMKWYLRSWVGASSPWRLLASYLGGAAATAAVVGRSEPQCAVTAVAGPCRDANPSILAHPALPLGFQQTGSCPLVINREQADATRRVIIFPFRPDSAEPAAVLKFWRLPWRNADTQREQEMVAELRSRLDPIMRQSIPSPLGTSQWGHVVVGGETCARGRPLSRGNRTRERRRIEELLIVTQWLLEFHRQTRASENLFSSSQMQVLVEGPLAAYDAAFGNTSEESKLFERVREGARSLLGCPLPLVWSHPAFSEWNIYRYRDRITVIDWEGTEVGPPLFDLIYFVTLWYYRSGRARGERAQVSSFQELFFRSIDDPLAATASAALDEYMKSLSVDPRFFPVMLVLTWVIHAEGRFKRVRTTSGVQVDSRNGNLHVGRVRVLAENRDRLFSEAKP